MKYVTLFVSFSSLLITNSILAATPATVYKNPNCSCCENYVKYLKKNSFEVKTINEHNMNAVKKRLGSDKLASCHTTEIKGYTVEGHVPFTAINKLLTSKLPIIGISVPGMPANSPGMGPELKGTLKVVMIKKNAQGMPQQFSVE